MTLFKKTLILLSFSILCIFINDDVYASTLSKPYSIDRHYSSASTCKQNGNNEDCYSTDTNILSTTINGNSSYSAGNYFYRYLGSMTDIPLYNQVNFVNLGGLCKNSNFTLSGKMYSNNSFFNKIRPTVFMQNNSGYFTCSYAYDSNDTLSFTCSNRTGSDGITRLALQFQWYYIHEQTTQLYLDTNLQYSCDVNTSDIINNQNNNTNSIINNQNQNQAQTNEKLDNINDSLTDQSSPNLGGLSNSAGWLPVGPVDSIINLPLSFFNNINDNLSKTCQSVVLPLPFLDENLTLPCVNTIYEQIDGLSVWIDSIGLIASAFILYSYFIKLYKWVDDTLTFRENTWNDWGGV